MGSFLTEVSTTSLLWCGKGDKYATDDDELMPGHHTAPPLTTRLRVNCATGWGSTAHTLARPQPRGPAGPACGSRAVRGGVAGPYRPVRFRRSYPLEHAARRQAG